MAKLNKIRLLTNYVDEANLKLESDLIMAALTDPHIDVVEAISGFAKKYNLSKPIAKRIFGTAQKLGYLKFTDATPSQGYKKLVVTPDKGQNIIQKRWGIPTGLLREVFDENKTLISILTAIVIAIATVINVILIIPR